MIDRDEIIIFFALASVSFFLGAMTFVAGAKLALLGVFGP